MMARERRHESEEVYWKRYQALSLEELSDRYDISHNPSIWKKLKQYSVDPHGLIAPDKLSDLCHIIRTACHEEPIMDFLRDNPRLLTRKITPAHHGSLCIPKPRLGSQFIPDFLIAGLDSAGWWWYGVELESPTKRMFRKNKDLSSTLSHAIRQIEDWRSWLQQHISYAQKELGFVQIDADLPCIVIIGRRENETLEMSSLQRRVRDVMRRDNCGLMIHHYEWLLES